MGNPFERLTNKVVVLFLKTLSSNKNTLVVMNYFRKFSEAFALPNQETILAKILVREFVSQSGKRPEFRSNNVPEHVQIARNLQDKNNCITPEV